MRMRLMLKMVSLVILTITTIVGARSCSGSSSSSPLNPVNLRNTGLGGLCANQNSVAQAMGDESQQTLVIPPSEAALARVPVLGLNPDGTLSCTTTTTSAGG